MPNDDHQSDNISCVKGEKISKAIKFKPIKLEWESNQVVPAGCCLLQAEEVVSSILNGDDDIIKIQAVSLI